MAILIFHSYVSHYQRVAEVTTILKATASDPWLKALEDKPLPSGYD